MNAATQAAPEDAASAAPAGEAIPAASDTPEAAPAASAATSGETGATSSASAALPAPPLAAPASTTASLSVPGATSADQWDSGASLWSSLLVTALALVFVLALAWLFLRLLKHFGSLRMAGGRVPPQVIQAVPLGGRERVVILRDGAHEYVLGVTAASVSLIDKRPALPEGSDS